MNRNKYHLIERGVTEYYDENEKIVKCYRLHNLPKDY